MKKQDRGRTATSLGRRPPQREQRKRVLIVSEGVKTEPNYFKNLRAAWRLSTADVEIVGEGASPGKVVERAIALIEKAKETEPYDKAWVVVDKDTHHDLDRAKEMVKGRNIKLILSTPCFELWFLLHFQYSTSPYNNFTELKRELKRFIPGYDKSKDYFSSLLKRLDSAVENARKLRQHNTATGSFNPATDVDKVVLCMRKLSLS